MLELSCTDKNQLRKPLHIIIDAFQSISSTDSLKEIATKNNNR